MDTTETKENGDPTGTASGAVAPPAATGKGTRPPFKFNIADGGFTELHTLWLNEVSKDCELM